jgi:naphthoate synthase
VTYEDILFVVDDGVLTLTINRPGEGNKFRKRTALELGDALRRFREEPSWRVAILTGAGDKFFCIGGEHESSEGGYGYSEVMPIVDVYELIDSIAKPIIAAVNGFAVGGGNVLQVVCDLSVASSTAIFRQVGPLVGSFDPGYGTWILEETVGRKRAKEMWYTNRKYSADEALRIGLVNEVVPGDELLHRVYEIAEELKRRGPGALGAVKGAFSARHSGVVGQARVAHDQMLTYYLNTEEAHELAESFNERRDPDTGRFGR